MVTVQPSHQPPAPYTREPFGVEYLLQQSGGDLLPLIDEGKEAEGEDSEAAEDDDEGIGHGMQAL